MAQVTIYTTPACVYCKMAKAFFDQNKVSYSEKDVAFDVEARNQMIQKSGQFGVPVVEIDGKIVVGFDKKRIAELVGVKL